MSFKPDPNFPWKEEDHARPMIGQGKMFVLNWKDTHFNPIVEPKHMLFQHGSMSFQAGRQAKAVAETARDQGPELMAAATGSRMLEAGTSSSSELVSGATRRKDREASARDQVLSSPQVPVKEAELSQGTGDGRELVTTATRRQETEPSTHHDCKLILAKKEKEIKLLNEKVKQLQNKLGCQSDIYDTEDIEELDSEAAFVSRKGFKRTNPQTKPSLIIKCTCCDYTSRSESDLRNHTDAKHPTIINCTVCRSGFRDKSELEKHKKKVHHSSIELNCNECQFQANTGPELKKHLNTRKHKAALGVDESSLGDTLKCKDCDQEFSDFWNLMNHRRDAHPEKRRRCRNHIKGECEFDDEGPNGCWWKHSIETSSTKTSNPIKNLVCNICEESFTNKFELMMHKKKDHEESVPLCRNMNNGHCDFHKCWFRHKDLTKQTPTQESISNKRPESDPVFLVSQSKTKPPEMNDLKEILLKAMEMITTVNRQMESILN